jgi:hypothetical protein
MNNFKRITLLAAVAVLIAVNILIYWNSHLYHQAEKIVANEQKIEVLDKSTQFYPLNGLVFYELGKAYFNLGMQNLNDEAKSKPYLQKSIQNFSRSIKINPASQFSHFDLAQTLLYMSFFSSSLEIGAFDEYKKAAILAGYNSQIYYEAGRILLSRWSQISNEDKELTLEMLRKIMERKDWKKIRTIMQTWELNVKDYDVMDRMLPEEPQIYRGYAKFLGEKSLSHEERRKAMARAEFLEFEKARSEHNAGEEEFLYYGPRKAFDYFRSCLNGLEKIKFYQNLTGQNLINRSEYIWLQKSSQLNLAKCRVEEGEELKDIEGYLRDYLALEDKVTAATDLESYLRERGLIREKPEASFEDLDRLSFQLYLSFKQNRYRDIIRIGQFLQESFIAVPQGKREEYVRILQLLGDSNQKIDYIYDAGAFYSKALEIDPDNLETLLRVRQNYERLNEEEKTLEIQKRIDKLVSPKEFVPENSTLNKGQRFIHPLVLDGRKITLNLHFKDSQEWLTPLVSAVFNGQVVWEDYLNTEILSVPLESIVGKNSVQIEALNRGISLEKIAYQ